MLGKLQNSWKTEIYYTLGNYYVAIMTINVWELCLESTIRSGKANI